jgi:hypothetical protein
MASGTDGDIFEANVVIDHVSTGVLAGSFRAKDAMRNTVFRRNVIIRSGGPGIEIRPGSHAVDVTISNNWLLDGLEEGIKIGRGRRINACIMGNFIGRPAGQFIENLTGSRSEIQLSDNRSVD